MLTVGIDLGARTIKVVVVRDGKTAGCAIRAAGFDGASTADEVVDEALRAVGSQRSEVDRVVATGAGREDVAYKDGTLTDVGAVARGAAWLYPDVRTVIDVGAEEARAIRCDGHAKVIDFAVNEKCAAGAGAFVDAMARALEVPIDQFGLLSLQSTQTILISAQCVVFAESEAVSLIHANVPKPDIARAVHDAIASRMVSMVRLVGCHPPVVLAGGMANNVGFVDSLRRGLDIPVLNIPDRPEFCAALGAALAAAEHL